jgi:hypothetical protein
MDYKFAFTDKKLPLRQKSFAEKNLNYTDVK